MPTFATGQQIAWFMWSPQPGQTLVWGIVRHEVKAVEAVSADGRTIAARMANDASSLEFAYGQPAQLIAHLADGSSQTITLPTCPPTTRRRPGCSGVMRRVACVTPGRRAAD
jgi:hypothetical protein